MISTTPHEANDALCVVYDDHTFITNVRRQMPPRFRRNIKWTKSPEHGRAGAHLQHECARKLFVFVSSGALDEMKPLISEANSRHHLRALLVREEDPRWIPQLLAESDLHALNRMHVHFPSDTDIPRRILAAWSIGAEQELIADARVVDDYLLVLSCAMERFEIAFDASPVLAKLSQEERSEFVIAEDGSHLHWPGRDIHIDLETFRYWTDPDFRRSLQAERAVRDEKLGERIAALRKAKGLTQKNIPGLSARQVRRLEKGDRPTVSALEKLARAHGLELSEYLDELARVQAEERLSYQ